MCPSIKAVSPERYMWSPSAVKANGVEANAPQIGGVNQSYAICNNWEIKDGRNITETDVLHATDVAVIGQDVVESLYKGKDPLGETLTINGKRVQVVGTFERKGSSGFGGQPDNIVVIPISTFDRHFPQTKNSHDDTIHIATIPRSPELVEQGHRGRHAPSCARGARCRSTRRTTSRSSRPRRCSSRCRPSRTRSRASWSSSPRSRSSSAGSAS